MADKRKRRNWRDAKVGEKCLHRCDGTLQLVVSRFGFGPDQLFLSCSVNPQYHWRVANRLEVERYNQQNNTSLPVPR